ncbi:MAG: hypothetical protein JXB38_01255 [Anaerolineales bacterium]|nr:hypothetical protein [Anaerolineales bacterium]
MNNPGATQAALDILRSGENFQWYVITFLALIVYVYANEAGKQNWRGIAAGLALYMVHWLAEIINGLIQHFSGHALWTVPTGTAFLILVGVGIELSFMFSIAGLVLSKPLPADSKLKLFGINNRLLWVIANAAFFAIVEIFLAKTPAFVWVYPWWGALPVFITVYIPFFWAAAYAYDAPPKAQKTFIGTLAAVNVVLLVICAGILHWI